MAITNYHDLEVYQRSMRALVSVHRLVQSFPSYERFALADQVRRASRSIPANIAEGYGRRRHPSDFRHFLDIAHGSANEMVVHLEITRELHYGPADVCDELIEAYTIIAKMLYRLRQNWRDSPPSDI